MEFSLIDPLKYHNKLLALHKIGTGTTLELLRSEPSKRLKIKVLLLRKI
jgi:hypothetical protein